MRIKGRLGEIKFKFNNTTDTMLYIPYEDVKFLIEQAERVHELEQQNKRYKQALEYIQKGIHKAIYTPKKQKWNSDFEREFESGKTRGLIQASDIVKEAIEILEGEGK